MRHVWAVVAGVLGIGSVATAYVVTHTGRDATIVANVAIIVIAVMICWVAFCQAMNGN